MAKLITLAPYNAQAQDWRRSFNDLNASHWELLAAATSTAIAIPDNMKLLQITSDDTLITSPNPITSVPTVGSPVTGQFYLNAPLIFLIDEPIIYIWSRQISDVVINFYEG